jgi:hypothetical protein
VPHRLNPKRFVEVAMSPRFRLPLFPAVVVLVLIVRPSGRPITAAPAPTKGLVRLRTDGLPTPLRLEGDRARRTITAVEVRGDIPAEGDGKGTVAFDESELTFNEFGDERVLKSRPGQPSAVLVRRVGGPDRRGAPRRLPGFPDDAASPRTRVYDIDFADGGLAGQLRLVLADDGIGPHRLLIFSGDKKDTLLQILNLHGRPEIQETLADAPRRGPLYLTTLSPLRPHTPGGLHAINLHGAPGGEASLQLDLNHLGFNLSGDVCMRTLMYHAPYKAKLRQIDVHDPLDKGRLLFDVEPADRKPTFRYQLVLAPTEAGPHRLLVRDGDALRGVLPLHDPARREHLAALAGLENASAEQRQAIAELRQLAGYHFRFKVESDKVVELSIDSGVDADKVDPVLRHLPHLTALQFHGSRLRAAGLPSLGRLTKLRSLFFSSAEISDAGLESLRQAPQLTSLHVYCCSGITDTGMKHLGGLTRLKYLRLYREDSLRPGFKGPRITSAGLPYLEDLTELESLDLMGQDVNDAGLKHLGGLKKLKDLSLSGNGITDAGLDHLKDLEHLERLHLYGTQTTPAGKAALRAKLPKLHVSE